MGSTPTQKDMSLTMKSFAVREREEAEDVAKKGYSLPTSFKQDKDSLDFFRNMWDDLQSEPDSFCSPKTSLYAPSQNDHDLHRSQHNSSRTLPLAPVRESVSFSSVEETESISNNADERTSNRKEDEERTQRCFSELAAFEIVIESSQPAATSKTLSLDFDSSSPSSRSIFSIDDEEQIRPFLIALFLLACTAMHLFISSPSHFWPSCTGVVCLGLAIEVSDQRRFENFRYASGWKRANHLRRNLGQSISPSSLAIAASQVAASEISAPLPKVKNSNRKPLENNATWTNRFWQQTRDDLKDIETEKKPSKKALPMTQKEKVQQMQDELMKLVQDAAKGGKIKLTRRHPDTMLCGPRLQSHLEA